MTIGMVLRVVAVVCFGLATAGVPVRIPLVPLGLTCWSLSTLVS